MQRTEPDRTEPKLTQLYLTGTSDNPIKADGLQCYTRPSTQGKDNPYYTSVGVFNTKGKLFSLCVLFLPAEARGTHRHTRTSQTGKLVKSLRLSDDRREMQGKRNGRCSSYFDFFGQRWNEEKTTVGIDYEDGSIDVMMWKECKVPTGGRNGTHIFGGSVTASSSVGATKSRGEGSTSRSKKHRHRNSRKRKKNRRVQGTAAARSRKSKGAL